MSNRTDYSFDPLARYERFKDYTEKRSEIAEIQLIKTQLDKALSSMSAGYFATVILHDALSVLAREFSFEGRENAMLVKLTKKYGKILKAIDNDNYNGYKPAEIVYESASVLWDTFEAMPITKTNTAISFDSKLLRNLLKIECAGSAVGSAHNLTIDYYAQVKDKITPLRESGMSTTIVAFERYFRRYEGVLEDLKLLDEFVYKYLQIETGKSKEVIEKRLDQLCHLFIDRGYAKLNSK